MGMPKDSQITAHVPAAVKSALEGLAREDGRPLSTYVERLLLAHLTKKKRLPVATKKAASVKHHP
jgi:hypothetical protein